MTTLVLLALAIGAVWLYRHRKPRTGAGASAVERARQLRTPLVRLADLVGIRTRRGALADRYAAGADGERRTAALLSPLRREGWAILHDRALPGTRANVDHLAIGPGGAVALVDSKRWSARWRLRVVNGRLLHGSHDVTDRLNGTRYETAAVAELLRTPVVPLVVVHGAPVDGGELVADGVRIVPADRAASVLRSLDRTGPSSSSTHLAARANRLLPPYRKGASR